MLSKGLDQAPKLDCQTLNNIATIRAIRRQRIQLTGKMGSKTSGFESPLSSLEFFDWLEPDTATPSHFAA